MTYTCWAVRYQKEDSDRDMASAGGGDYKRAGMGHEDVPGTRSDNFNPKYAVRENK